MRRRDLLRITIISVVFWGVFAVGVVAIWLGVR